MDHAEMKKEEKKEPITIPIETKKPLTHDVYDKWESIGERAISNNGKYIVYVVNPQEGDGNLYLKDDQGKLIKQIPRGYSPIITTDNQFLICKIKPFFKENRDARIKKKRPDEMPKDSLAIYNCVTDSMIKIAKIKSVKTPEKGSGWVAYLLEKNANDVTAKPKTVVAPDSTTQISNVLKMADSLRKIADSLVLKAKEAKDKGLVVLAPVKKDVKPVAKPNEDPVEEGTDLVLRNLVNGKEQIFKLTNEYYFDKYGKKLLIETSKKNGDSLKKAMLLWQNLASYKLDTIFIGFNDAKNYAIDETAEQLAFVVEKDSAAKALKKFYSLYYYANGEKEARQILGYKDANLLEKKLTISADYNNSFSKDGSKLYFGLAPIRKPKDTTLVDFETARLDIWNYKEDYLQTQQLVQLNQELRRSFVSVIYPKQNANYKQLGTDTTENIQLVNEGNANIALATSSKGNRAAAQWNGFALQNAYIVNMETGTTTKFLHKAKAQVSISPMGKYAIWYDYKIKNWLTYNVATKAIKNISQLIKVPLFDEEDDHPDDPSPHGLMRWSENDAAVFIYDKYDIWKCNPEGTATPILVTNGRAKKITTRFVNTDIEDRFLLSNKEYLFTTFNNTSKEMGIEISLIEKINKTSYDGLGTTFRGFVRAKDSLNNFIYTCENPTQSPYILHYKVTPQGDNPFDVKILHEPNLQQEEYIWYNNELETWKMFDGKMSEGILYKPENFDQNKKYPIIFYFYERDADDLYNYRSPAPSASTINIPWFVSNGYLVFDPNIYYKNGEPGESAYNSIVSAAKYLTKKYKWIDSTKMAIQGQSWGGYQVAYLVTRTNIFAAAGAGAPVSNMTSAYGGIRWGSGVTRQFQYEKGQTRIGGTLWDKRDLYLKNSPLFAVPKIKTPLLLMHNDKDGAVPWYQSIEFFTALKRNDKKVWLLQYNDEDHNLIERRNRKDLSVRLGQFFDHYLKGKPMPKWMAEGVPATEKGIEWGL
jgi:dienelactone hydrolase